MLNEIDIRDYEQLPIRELHKAQPRSYVMVPSWDNSVIFFDHIDGMYSFCLNMLNEVVHLAAWTEVVPLQKKTIDAE